MFCSLVSYHRRKVTNTKKKTNRKRSVFLQQSFHAEQQLPIPGSQISQHFQLMPYGSGLAQSQLSENNGKQVDRTTELTFDFKHAEVETGLVISKCRNGADFHGEGQKQHSGNNGFQHQVDGMTNVTDDSSCLVVKNTGSKAPQCRDGLNLHGSPLSTSKMRMDIVGDFPEDKVGIVCDNIGTIEQTYLPASKDGMSRIKLEEPDSDMTARHPNYLGVSNCLSKYLTDRDIKAIKGFLGQYTCFENEDESGAPYNRNINDTTCTKETASSQIENNQVKVRDSKGSELTSGIKVEKDLSQPLSEDLNNPSTTSLESMVKIVKRKTPLKEEGSTCAIGKSLRSAFKKKQGNERITLRKAHNKAKLQMLNQRKLLQKITNMTLSSPDEKKDNAMKNWRIPKVKFDPNVYEVSIEDVDASIIAKHCLQKDKILTQFIENEQMNKRKGVLKGSPSKTAFKQSPRLSDARKDAHQKLNLPSFSKTKGHLLAPQTEGHTHQVITMDKSGGSTNSKQYDDGRHQYHASDSTCSNVTDLSNSDRPQYHVPTATCSNVTDLSNSDRPRYHVPTDTCLNVTDLSNSDRPQYHVLTATCSNVTVLSNSDRPQYHVPTATCSNVTDLNNNVIPVIISEPTGPRSFDILGKNVEKVRTEGLHCFQEGQDGYMEKMRGIESLAVETLMDLNHSFMYKNCKEAISDCETSMKTRYPDNDGTFDICNAHEHLQKSLEFSYNEREPGSINSSNLIACLDNFDALGNKYVPKGKSPLEKYVAKQQKKRKYS